MNEFRKTVIKLSMLLFVMVIIFACAGTPEPLSDSDIKSEDTTTSIISDDSNTESTPVIESVPLSKSIETDSSNPEDTKLKKELVSEETAIFADEALRSADLSYSGEEEVIFYDEDKSMSDSSDAPTAVRAAGTAAPSESGLKAGYSDDNKQFNYFVKFLEQYKTVSHLNIDISERIIFNIKDSDNLVIPNAEVSIKSAGTIITSGRTLADGSFRFYPALYGTNHINYEILVQDLASGNKTGDQFTRDGRREINLILNTKRKLEEQIPLDILFILDTTGSMGEEIQRLKATIQLIHLNLSNLPTKPLLRFGLVLYKDDGDEEYRTKIVHLTDDLDEFQKQLNMVEASGGGDTPEDLQAALENTMIDIEWNDNGIRLAFIITDAPPHLDYGQEYNYVQASLDAKKRGIKIHSVGTGGLPLEGEYILRQISQFTSGRYIFLTYGEQEESEGGSVGSVSHHTGANFQTDKLEAIIIRFAKEELSYLSDKTLDMDDPFFEATKINTENKEETLDTLFGMAVEQLRDYSTYTVDINTKAAIVPFSYKQEELSLDAEYFTERLILSSESSEFFTLVERKDIQKILTEQNLQLSGITEGEDAVKIGKILNADVLITGNLFGKDESYELFLRLVRVETGEILSVTRSVIDRKLGIR
jgi:Mg-chelatase subunit ChlD